MLMEGLLVQVISMLYATVNVIALAGYWPTVIQGCHRKP